MGVRKHAKMDDQMCAELLRYCRVRGPDDCWEWQKARTGHGYGTLRRQGLPYDQAHRLSYALFVGPIPDGMWVLHRCDNPPCINPRHLFVGTSADNSHDRNKKGRNVVPGLKGEENAVSTLSNRLVLSIRADTRPQDTIAAHYGINQSTVSRIKNLKRWRHLPCP